MIREALDVHSQLSQPSGLRPSGLRPSGLRPSGLRSCGLRPGEPWEGSLGRGRSRYYLRAYIPTYLHAYIEKRACDILWIVICHFPICCEGLSWICLRTVGLHNFNLRIFNLRVSIPNKLVVDVFLTRCRISMCQGLGPNKHDEISEIDRSCGGSFAEVCGDCHVPL